MKPIETVEEIGDEVVEEHKTVKQLLIDMKDLSEMMIDLAYSALLLNSKVIAEEVKEMEEVMNKLRYAIEIKAMLAARNQRDAEDLTGILHVAHAAERIGNAARSIVDVVEREEADHPVLISMLTEGEERISKGVIGKKSAFVGKTLKELKDGNVISAYIIAVRRDKKWIYKFSNSKFTFKDGDVLLATGEQKEIEVFNKKLKG